MNSKNYCIHIKKESEHSLFFIHSFHTVTIFFMSHVNFRKRSYYAGNK